MAHDELGPADIDRLADYIGGALDGPDSAEVARLIADDPRWRSTHDLLASGMTAVGAELRAMGAEPMPADIAVRLDEALAAAPERHLTVVPGSDEKPRGEVRGKSRRLRWAVPAAAAAAVLTFAGFGADYLASQDGGSADRASSAPAAGLSAENAAPMHDAAGAAPVRDDQILETGTNYTSATLAAAPVSVAAGKRSDAQAAPFSRPSADIGADALHRLRARDALQACIDAIARVHASGPITVETVDFARYASRPALVVRFVSAGATWAYAAGANCGTPDRGADVLDRVQVR